MATRPKGKKPTTRGRKMAADKKEARGRAEAPPAPLHNWLPAVEKITEDPAKRTVLLIELASLDEVEQEMRAQVLAGSSTAGRVWLGIKQQRAKLLGLFAPPSPPPPQRTPDGEIDVPVWTASEGAEAAQAPAPAQPVEPSEPDDDINSALSAALGPDELH